MRGGAEVTAIAIDGPAGSGKSTVARAVAQEIGARFLDTGALYRAVALAAHRAGVDADDGTTLGKIADDVQIEMAGDRVLLNGEDVSDAIRTEEVTAVVSKVSAHPEVRDALIEVQRDLARRGDVVLEGRDIGTEVLPDADVKIFLTADLETRARRRCLELHGDCDDALIDKYVESLRGRDAADSDREASPLRKAPGLRASTGT